MHRNESPTAAPAKPTAHIPDSSDDDTADTARRDAEQIAEMIAGGDNLLDAMRKIAERAAWLSIGQIGKIAPLPGQGEPIGSQPVSYLMRLGISVTPVSPRR